MTVLRDGFPVLPDKIKSLPIHTNGYPIPYFVSYFEGVPDFRVMDPNKFIKCVNNNLCWICGQKLGRHKAFSAGPLLSVSKLSAEPPSHRDCAVFAAQVCPFMLLPKSKHRVAKMPLESSPMAGGAVMERNPGATLVWVTHAYDTTNNGDAALFNVHEPSEVLWYSEGKLASREVAMGALHGSVDASFQQMPTSQSSQRELLIKRSVEAEKYLPKF